MKRGKIMGILNLGESITLKHSVMENIRKCPTGFSITAFVFGGIVPLVRGNFKWFILYYLIAIIYVVFFIMCAMTESETLIDILSFGGFGINAVFAFYYNAIYIKSSLESGYIPADETSKEWLANKRTLTELSKSSIKD